MLTVRFALAVLLVVPLALRVPGLAPRPARAPRRCQAAAAGRLFAGVYGGMALGVPAALSALVVLGSHRPLRPRSRPPRVWSDRRRGSGQRCSSASAAPR